MFAPALPGRSRTASISLVLSQSDQDWMEPERVLVGWCCASPPVGDHHREVDQHPAPIMDRPPIPPGQGIRQRLRQAGSIGQNPQQRRAHLRHHARTVGGDPQVPRPRRKLHCENAFSAREPDRFDTVSSLSGEALFLIYTPATGQDPRSRRITQANPGRGTLQSIESARGYW